MDAEHTPDGANLHFLCVEGRPVKQRLIRRSLSGLGRCDWKTLPPLSFRGYPETEQRATEAFATSKRKHDGRYNGWLRWLKKRAIALFYNGSRRYFTRHPDRIAVCWNGLNGQRRAFMDGARDAYARTLFFELAPFQNSITIDPCGVNFLNGLPREIAPYHAWHAQNPNRNEWQDVARAIVARKARNPTHTPADAASLDLPFLFVPLQVPLDSQLRLFGGRYSTVEDTIRLLAEAAKSLPDPWHLRLKEHPSARTSFAALFADIAHAKVILDNTTDTFGQVRKSRGVVTVNSSVGLEAMFFDKPVVALGQCFWAIDGVARHIPDPEGLQRLLRNPELIAFNPDDRAAFLACLIGEYYIRLDPDPITATEIAKIRRRLQGADPPGFWLST